MKKRHIELRKEMLQELAEEYATNNNREATKVIKEIIATEQTKKTYRNIRYALGKQRNSSILRLLIPLNTNSEKVKTTKVLSTKQEIHESIIDYNIKHYSKAEASPVGIGTPLHEKLGPYGISPFCDRVLQGNMNFHDLEDIPMSETVELLKSMVKPQIHSTNQQTLPHNTPAEINISLDNEDYTKMFKKWKEKTTTSPSGRHLGHYKSILQEPELIKYHCIMASLPLKYGFTPKRWTKAIQIMLEKKTGNPLLHRLRGILILEADLN